VISALSLFLFTAVAGRLWCGYACPQTVYTEIFLWIEHWIEGDRPARMRLDAAPANARKFGLKAAKHGIWIALSLWTGFTFVGYFSPVRELLTEAVHVHLGPWETFWIFFYGFTTYGNAGWMREQVCKYMCPYARFQSVMFDPDTLIITYDGARGEPRGPRGRGADSRATGLGDCVDCNLCVQVCPTGIDIRQGLQYECIGCAACIDGCNQVMDRFGYPHGLIRYTTDNAVHGAYPDGQIVRHVLRPRTLVYTGVLLAIIAAFSVLLFVRVPLKVDVIRDRATMVREIADGRLENVYRLQIMNTAETTRRLLISVTGIEGMEVIVKQPVEVPVASTTTVPVTLRVDPALTTPGTHPLRFTIKDMEDERVRTEEKSVFFVR
jgi:cytochrome c oxidase accessory protein FixG